MRIDKSLLIQQAIDSLHRSWGGAKLSFEFRETPGERYDGIVEVLGNLFLCFIEREMSPASYELIKRRIEAGRTSPEKPVLLVSELIPPQFHHDLREQHICFMDSQGNLLIRIVDGERLLIEIVNQEEAPHSARRAYPLFKEAGLKVLFYLLQDLDRVNQPFRTIGSASGVSIGTVKNIIDELQARGYLLISSRGRKLKHTRRLLDDWAESYALIQRPKLLLQRFAFRTPADQDAWQDIQLPTGMWWGGEGAASLRQGYLHPESFIIYSEVQPAQLMRSGAVQQGTGEITVYHKFWEGDTMPALLVYADLVASGNSRNFEAANQLLADELPYIQ